MTAAQTVLEEEMGREINMDGSVGCRVDNPADIVALDPVSISEALSSCTLTAAAGEGEGLAEGIASPEPEAGAEGTLEEKVDGFLEEGNAHLNAERLEEAIQCYTKCIGALESAAPHPDFIDQRKVAPYSQRAEAWVRKKQFAHGLRDADSALKLDPKHAKSACRRGRALIGLECYREAATCLQKLLRMPTKNSLPAGTRQGMQSLLQAAITADKQSRLGAYNLSHFCLSGFRLPPPICVDYVGPVEVRSAGDMGRGLFVTREVFEGQLLLVSNPLAVVPAEGASEEGAVASDSALPATAGGGDPNSASLGPEAAYAQLKEALITEIVQACRKCPRKLRQLFTLGDAFQGGKDTQVPPMSLYMPPNVLGSSAVIMESEAFAGNACEEEDIDVSRIRRILGMNSFRAAPWRPLDADERSGTVYLDTSRSLQKPVREGLWVLPSLINHSCAPNCLAMHVGDSMFVRACRRLAAGEEVTIAYTNTYRTMEERTRYFKLRNCRCECARCNFERGVMRQFPAIFQMLGTDSASMLRMSSVLSNAGPAHADLVAGYRNYVDTVQANGLGDGITGTLERYVMAQVTSSGDEADVETRRNWIRSSFLPAYHAQVAQLSVRLHFGAAPTLEDLAAWAEAVDFMLGIIAACPCDDMALTMLAMPLYQVLHRNLAVPEHLAAKWTAFAQTLCRRYYGLNREIVVIFVMKKLALPNEDLVGPEFLGRIRDLQREAEERAGYVRDLPGEEEED